MKAWMVWGMVGVALVASIGRPARGQEVVRERDATITGPRGRTIERQFRSERGLGYVDRQLQIQRGGATLRREVQVQRPAGFVGGGGFVAPGRPAVIERDVVIARPPIWGPTFAFGAPFAFGLGAPFFNFVIGAPPPPPVVVAPPPVVVGAPPVVVPPAPGPVVVVPRPQVAVPDAFSDAINRLHSLHNHSRRDGCLALGRMRDPRAVPALVDRLKKDTDKEVRMAAAWALGEIADPRAGVALERAALFDWRKDVRDAAAGAYQRLPKEGQPPAQPPASTARMDETQSRVRASILQTEAAPPPPPAPPDPNPPPPPQPEPGPFSNGATRSPGSR